MGCDHFAKSPEQVFSRQYTVCLHPGTANCLTLPYVFVPCRSPLQLNSAPNFAPLLTSSMPAANTMRSPVLKKASFCGAIAAYTTTLAFYQIQKMTRARNRSRKNPKYLRGALLRPVNTRMTTPWNQILSCGKDDDFLVSLNVTHSLFTNKLMPLFEYERERCNYGSPYRIGPKVRGRKPFLRSCDLLGMALWYLKTKASMYSLCPIFGVVPSSIGVWMDFSLQVLLHVVKRKSRREFEIRWPSVEEMEASSSLLQSNRVYGPFLKGVFAVTDGGRMPCADYTDKNLQNAYYEGYTQNVEVTNLFVWNFFGEIIHAAVNYPGSWHDTKLAGASGLYDPKLLDENTPPGFAILGDSAFVNNTSTTNGKVLRGRKTNEVNDIPESAALAAVDLIMQRIMPSERQSAEWGVRALKGPFQRLKTPLPADSLKRLRLLRICCHLYNFRVRYVGLNQIRSTYSSRQLDQ